MTSFIEILAELLSGFFKLLGELGQLLFEAIFPKRTKKYEARFTPEKKILSRKNKGWAIGTKAIPLTFQGLFIAAASGYGKTSFCVLPGLIKQIGLAVIFVLDSSGELYAKISGYCKKQNIPVTVFNFSDKTGCYSDGWNPFPKDKSEVPNFCTLLTQLALGENPHDPFWSLKAAALLEILALSLFSLPEEYRTVGSLYDLLTMLAAKPKLIELWMAKYADKKTWIEFVAFMQNSPNTRASIISSAKSVLTLFSQEGIRKITSHQSIDFENIRNTNQVVFLMTSGAELNMYKMLISLFFNSLIASILKEIPKPDAPPIHIMLEEAGIIKVPILPLAITQCRKYFVNICAVVQSETQWSHLYTKDECDTILSNFSTKLYLSNAPLHKAKELSELMGAFEYRDEDDHIKHAPLLSPHEIREIPIGSGILLHQNLAPAFLKKIIPYYKDAYMKRITSLPPAHIERRLSDDTIPELPIMDLMKQTKK